jgi:AraC-like DNA-binding protein
MEDDRVVLWRVQGYGRQEVPPERAYWWENAGRQPVGKVYAQYTVGGRIIHRDEHGEERDVLPGWLLLFRHGENTVYGRPKDETATYHCEWVGLVGAGLVEHWQVLQERYGSLIDLGGDDTVRVAMNRLMDVAYPSCGATPIAQAAAVQQFVMQLFVSLENRSRRSRPPLEAAVDELVGNPLGVGKLEALAHRHGISREHLTRAFRARTGMPPHTWLTKARLERAVHLLRNTALPLASVAEQSGFPSVHTMAWQVRRSAGIPPSRLRE